MERAKEWLPIPGFEGYYAVSNDGEVMSMNYRRTGLPGILKPMLNTQRYPQVELCPAGSTKRHYLLVPYLVLLAFVGPRPKGLVINHIDSNPLNNRVENLEYCTQKENVHHAWKHGNAHALHGEEHGSSTLKDGDVRGIRKLLRMGFKQEEIASMTGTSQSTVSDIKLNKRWAHVKDEENV